VCGAVFAFCRPLALFSAIAHGSPPFSINGPQRLLLCCRGVPEAAFNALGVALSGLGHAYTRSGGLSPCTQLLPRARWVFRFLLRCTTRSAPVAFARRLGLAPRCHTPYVARSRRLGYFLPWCAGPVLSLFSCYFPFLCLPPSSGST
jgi:hypothetical protein